MCRIAGGEPGLFHRGRGAVENSWGQRQEGKEDRLDGGEEVKRQGQIEFFL